MRENTSLTQAYKWSNNPLPPHQVDAIIDKTNHRQHQHYELHIEYIIVVIGIVIIVIIGIIVDTEIIVVIFFMIIITIGTFPHIFYKNSTHPSFSWMSAPLVTRNSIQDACPPPAARWIGAMPFLSNRRENTPLTQYHTQHNTTLPPYKQRPKPILKTKASTTMLIMMMIIMVFDDDDDHHQNQQSQSPKLSWS